MKGRGQELLRLSFGPMSPSLAAQLRAQGLSAPAVFLAELDELCECVVRLSLKGVLVGAEKDKVQRRITCIVAKLASRQGEPPQKQNGL